MPKRASSLSLALLPALAALSFACSRESAPEPPKATASAAQTTAAAPSATPSSSVGAAPHAGPKFVEDDYDAALAEARRRNVPLFVDAWAPWCHTCLSLRAYVFPDPLLAPLAERFVWLAIDTEKDKNAGFLAKNKLAAWPTLFVIDPKTETSLLKWPGSLTAPELTALLTEASHAFEKNDGSGTDAVAAMVRGDQAAAAGKSDDAIAEYKTALAKSPDGALHARVVDSLTTQLAKTKAASACVTLAATELPHLAPGTSAANVGLTGLSCAGGLPKGDPATPTVSAIASAVEQMAEDPSLVILADDRSGLFEEAVSFRDDHGDKDRAKKLAGEWAAFLEGEAAKATTKEARAVFDAHRLLAYTELGTIEKAIPMLQESEKDFPTDYNPPARLAKAYFDLKRYDDAFAASTRAIDRAYGPRALRLYALRADILLAKGDKPGAKVALESAVKSGHDMKLEGGYAKLEQDLEARLAKM